MIEPSEEETGELQEEGDAGLVDMAEYIQIDQWGNEWDSEQEFGEMDFRLVDE